VDFEIVWKTIQNELFGLHAQVHAILQAMSDEDAK
jgi:uncharacterized protein with HEPN domain